MREFYKIKNKNILDYNRIRKELEDKNLNDFDYKDKEYYNQLETELVILEKNVQIINYIDNLSKESLILELITFNKNTSINFIEIYNVLKLEDIDNLRIKVLNKRIDEC